MVRQSGGALLSTLKIAPDSGVPYYRQLEEAIRRLILSGDLAAGCRLPATRELSKDLQVSRLTVKNVYEQLAAERFLETKPGAGTFVAEISASEKPPAAPGRRLRAHDSELLSQRARQIGSSMAVTRLGGYRAFRPGVPALDQFPRRVWASTYSRVMRHADAGMLGYGPPGGLDTLKRAIAAHVRDHRGVKVDAEQIIVTAGAQQAFSLIAFTLLNPGDVVWWEDPGHIAGRDAMRIFGADVRPTIIDHEGLDLQFAKARHPDARLIFTTPSHQHPLGVTMSLGRRLALLDYAEKRAVWIVEDDYDSEFRFHGRALPAMQSLDSSGRVLYVGSFSKSLYPGLRLGYVIVPYAVAEAFSSGQILLSQNVSAVLQQTLAHFIDDGSYNSHIRKMRILYRRRHEVLSEHLRAGLSDVVEIRPSAAGLHLIAHLVDKRLDDRAVAQALWTNGIDCLPLSIFSDRTRLAPAIVLGFACAPEHEIAQRVRDMSAVLRSCFP